LAELEVSIEVSPGAPAESIVEVAGRQPDTLIAMATHGYGGLKRWALGSVADKVLHATMTPFLLVPIQAQAPEP
jgi:nucleotide-binding universal stress UspA family protein